jgi:hypothetical protein
MRCTLTRFLLIATAAASAALAGCNAVYFYETDKISLTVEVRPDSTGPVQGNFGLKQRVVAFVPKRNGEPATPAERDAALAEAKSAIPDSAAASRPAASQQERQELKRKLARAVNAVSDSDAMSVLSSMRFHKLPKPDGAPWYKVSHIKIDAALITGAAAGQVANPGRAIRALAGQSNLAGLDRVAALRGVVTALQDAQKRDPRAAEYVRRLDELAPGLIPPEYTVAVYIWSGEDAPPRKDKLETRIRRGKRTGRASFDDVLTYWAQVQDTADKLSALPSGPFTLDGAPVTDATRAELAREADAAKAELRSLEARLGNQSVIRDAAAYMANNL